MEERLTDSTDLGRQLAAALVAPHVAHDDETVARFTMHVRALLDVTSVHIGAVEAQPVRFWPARVARAPFVALALRLPAERRRALTLDALTALALRTPCDVLALARACEPVDASLVLARVIADGAREPEDRFAALDTLCALTSRARDGSLARAAAAALAACLVADDATVALVRSAAVCIPELVARYPLGGIDIEALLEAWPALMARTDVPASVRIDSWQSMRNAARAPVTQGALDEARSILVRTAATDRELARALLTVAL